MAKLKDFIMIEIGKLVKADWNYKEDDDDIKEALKANIKRNGQVENIVVREIKTGFYEIVNGNHRYDALLDLGIKKVVCYNAGKMTTPAAMRLAVELNETRFPSDKVELSKVFKEMIEEFSLEDLSATFPFSEDEIKASIDLLDYDFDNVGDAGDDGDDGAEVQDGKELKVTMSDDIYHKWLDWKSKCETGSDNDAFAKAINIAMPE